MKSFVTLFFVCFASLAQAGPGQFEGRKWNCSGLNATPYERVEATITEIIFRPAEGPEETSFRLQVSDFLGDSDQLCANGDPLFRFSPKSSLKPTETAGISRVEFSVGCEAEIYYALHMYCTQENI
jgi:hypothetical protein